MKDFVQIFCISKQMKEDFDVDLAAEQTSEDTKKVLENKVSDLETAIDDASESITNRLLR